MRQRKRGKERKGENRKKSLFYSLGGITMHFGERLRLIFGPTHRQLSAQTSLGLSLLMCKMGVNNATLIVLPLVMC